MQLNEFWKNKLNSYNQRPFLWGFFLVCFLVNFPPVHTGNIIHNITKFKDVPSKVEAGSVLVVNKTKYPLNLNSQVLSSIEDSDKQFGVISVYSSKTNYLGYIPKQYSNWRESLKRSFRGPEIVWTYQIIELNKVSLKKSKKLRLPSSVLKKLSSVQRETKKKEWQKLKSTLSQHNGNIRNLCFQYPVHSKVISKYASPRRLPSGRTYYHTGLDMRAWYGTPIRAAGSGRLALQEHMTAPGNNVLIDHGGGLYSRYMHFSKFGKQNLNDEVKAGQIIGYSGSTGRSQAPHLHFEIIWKGNHASPESFLRSWEQICDQV